MDEYIRTRIRRKFANKEITEKEIGYSRLRPESIIFRLIRYADDIVILTKTRKMAILCKETLEDFLKPRGLILSSTKTKLTDLSGGKAYFEFVGYGFSKISYYKDEKWFIIPPVKNIDRIKNKLKLICRNNSSIYQLFSNYNQILKSWVGYYYSTNSRKAFKNLTNWTFKVFYNALSRRIRKTKNNLIYKNRRNRNTVSEKYLYNYIKTTFLKEINYRDSKLTWFSLESNEFRKKSFSLFCPQIFQLNKAFPLTGNNLNFYNIEDLITISKININYKFGSKQRVLTKNRNKFGGICKCTMCMIPFLETIKFEFHHKLPVEFGGQTNDSNLILLCKICHTKITTAVKSRNYELCTELIEMKLLEIPKNIINSKFYQS